LEQELKHPIVAAGNFTGLVCQVLGTAVAGFVAYLLYAGEPWRWPSETEPSKWMGLSLVTGASLLVACGIFWLGFLFRRRLLFSVLSVSPLVLSGLNEVEVRSARTAFRIGTNEALGVPGVGYVARLGAGWYIICAEAAAPYAAFVAGRKA
jgi:hypothetical protein